jgi:hypothetical protein
MLKRLMIFLVVNVTLAGVIVPLTLRYGPQTAGRELQNQHEAQSSQQAPWWYQFLTWPGGITTWAILLTLEAIAWQSFETYRSAQAARKAAEASLRLTEHTEKAERAWLIIRSSMDGYVPGVDDDLRYWWALENVGDLPARIIETQCLYEIVQDDPLLKLPSVPRYPDPIILNGFLIPPRRIADYHTFLRRWNDGHPVVKGEIDNAVIQALQMERRWLRVYGYVQYFDGMSDEPKESRFCDYYVWPLGTRPPRATGFRPLIGAPSEYTKCT